MSVTPLVRHLRPGAREWFMAWLTGHHPGLVPRYEDMYAGGAYAPRWYQRRITGRVHEPAEQYGCGPGRSGQARRKRTPAFPASRTTPRRPPRALPSSPWCDPAPAAGRPEAASPSQPPPAPGRSRTNSTARPPAHGPT